MRVCVLHARYSLRAAAVDGNARTVQQSFNRNSSSFFFYVFYSSVDDNQECSGTLFFTPRRQTLPPSIFVSVTARAPLPSQ